MHPADFAHFTPELRVNPESPRHSITSVEEPPSPREAGPSLRRLSEPFMISRSSTHSLISSGGRQTADPSEGSPQPHRRLATLVESDMPSERGSFANSDSGNPQAWQRGSSRGSFASDYSVARGGSVLVSHRVTTPPQRLEEEAIDEDNYVSRPCRRRSSGSSGHGGLRRSSSADIILVRRTSDVGDGQIRSPGGTRRLSSGEGSNLLLLQAVSSPALAEDDRPEVNGLRVPAAAEAGSRLQRPATASSVLAMSADAMLLRSLNDSTLKRSRTMRMSHRASRRTPASHRRGSFASGRAQRSMMVCREEVGGLEMWAVFLYPLSLLRPTSCSIHHI